MWEGGPEVGEFLPLAQQPVLGQAVLPHQPLGRRLARAHLKGVGGKGVDR